MEDFDDEFLTESEKEKSRQTYKREFYPYRLVEPSNGRIVELEVIEKDECTAELCMEILITYADSIVRYSGGRCSVANKRVRMEFPDEDSAKKERNSWK